MITYHGVTYHNDLKDGIAYFFNESRLEFCKECPIKDGDYETEDHVFIKDGECPCSTLKAIASATVSSEAYEAIRETGAFEEFLDIVKTQDSPVGQPNTGRIII